MHRSEGVIRAWRLSGVLALSVLAAWGGRARAGEPVTVLKTPDGGIQPQAAADESGTIHLVYLKGDPGASDVYYARKAPGEKDFSTPIRVNSLPGSAIAVGTIRGAQLAIGRGGRVHVIWNGSDKARPKNPIEGSPLLYTRLDDRREAFERERNLMKHTYGLDGGGTVAADPQGHVYVAWHGREPGALDGEMGRRLYVARSDDDGRTFASEQPALAQDTGACGCCGTRALADRRGNLYMMYRAAKQGVERDLYLVASRDGGRHAKGLSLQPWKVNACPMSSESMAEGRADVVAAWETQGEVAYSRLDPESLSPSRPMVKPEGGHGNRKHPAVAENTDGAVLMAWTEGTGWQKGGTLVWQRFDKADKPIGPAQRLEGGVPVWGLPTAVSQPDGSFVLIH